VDAGGRCGEWRARAAGGGRLGLGGWAVKVSQRIRDPEDFGDFGDLAMMRRRVVVCAVEASGDALAAKVMKELKAIGSGRGVAVEFVGVGG